MKKKAIPVLAAGTLIIVIILFMLIGKLINKYTPTKDRQDLREYYGISSDDEVPIILNNEVLDVHAKQIDGNIYLDFNTVHEKLNSRFYWDSYENKLLYTTASDLVTVDAENTSYYVGKNSYSYDRIIVKADARTAYVDIGFVKLYSDFNYQIYYAADNPKDSASDFPVRVVINNAWGETSVASTKKNTEIRSLGGIKSPILADVKKGTELTVLAPDETWTKVATSDGIIGYVKSKTLGKTSTKTLTSEYIPDEFTHIKKNFAINLGWHQVTNAAANSSINTILPNAKGLNVISPTWFYLNDNNGNVVSLASSDYVNYCHQNGVEVWALVSNLENPDVNTTEVLSHTSKRQNLINNLISAAIQYNFDGINVDFESLSPEAGEGYIQFIRELSLKCANNDIVLSVDNYVPTAYTSFYNRAEQALFADYIVIMAYDEHYAGSEEAGSVASIGFVKEGVANTLKEVPADQIILGMPFYTRVWSEKPLPADAAAENDKAYELDSYAASMNEIQNLLNANGITPVWSDEAGQYYAEYVTDGITNKIWIENAVSLEEKLKVLQENHLAGGAFWKLGLENNAIWDTILKYIN